MSRQLILGGSLPASTWGALPPASAPSSASWGSGCQALVFSPLPPDIRACASTPCANSGTCMNLEKGHYECSCAPGFSGKDCRKTDGPCVVNG